MQGFAYDIRTALLPFLFIFNTELLLIDVSAFKAVFVFIVAVVAMMLFAAATQGFFLTKNRAWESLAMLLIAFTLFRPGFWLDRIDAPFIEHESAAAINVANDLPADQQLRLIVSGPDLNDDSKTFRTTVVVNSEDGATGEARYEAQGLFVTVDGDTATFEEPLPGSPFVELSRKLDFYGDNPVVIEKVQTPADRMAKEIFYIPALILLGLIVLLQRGRAAKNPNPIAA